MKLKEYPNSFFETLKLLCISPEKLQEKKNVIPVVVSLTTIASRLNKVHITLRSVMNQSVKPKQIVLWIHENDQYKIPQSLQKLTGDLLEIRTTPHTSSHKKLIPSLLAFPDAIIVTCDDDLIYEKDWLKNLYETHVNYPNDIIGHKARRIRVDEANKALEYKSWEYTEQNDLNHNLLIGEGGILYPPYSLHAMVTDYDLALKITPKSDDLWFKAMALKNNTGARLSDKISKRFIPIVGTQKISLKKINVGQNMNASQLDNLIEYFNFDLR
jgi:hypothetical protein